MQIFIDSYQPSRSSVTGFYSFHHNTTEYCKYSGILQGETRVTVFLSVHSVFLKIGYPILLEEKLIQVADEDYELANHLNNQRKDDTNSIVLLFTDFKVIPSELRMSGTDNSSIIDFVNTASEWRIKEQYDNYQFEYQRILVEEMLSEYCFRRFSSGFTSWHKTARINRATGNNINFDSALTEFFDKASDELKEEVFSQLTKFQAERVCRYLKEHNTTISSQVLYELMKKAQVPNNYFKKEE